MGDVSQPAAAGASRDARSLHVRFSCHTATYNTYVCARRQERVCVVAWRARGVVAVAGSGERSYSSDVSSSRIPSAPPHPLAGRRPSSLPCGSEGGGRAQARGAELRQLLPNPGQHGAPLSVSLSLSHSLSPPSLSLPLSLCRPRGLSWPVLPPPPSRVPRSGARRWLLPPAGPSRPNQGRAHGGSASRGPAMEVRRRSSLPPSCLFGAAALSLSVRSSLSLPVALFAGGFAAPHHRMGSWDGARTCGPRATIARSGCSLPRRICRAGAPRVSVRFTGRWCRSLYGISVLHGGIAGAILYPVQTAFSSTGYSTLYCSSSVWKK